MSLKSLLHNEFDRCWTVPKLWLQKTSKSTHKLHKNPAMLKFFDFSSLIWGHSEVHLKQNAALFIFENLIYSNYVFLVGAFSLKEKNPTITVSCFFSVDLTLGPLFTNCSFVQLRPIFWTRRAWVRFSHQTINFVCFQKYKWDQRVSLWVFSALCDIFRSFLIFSKGTRLPCFEILGL